jgi:hypothetical protein
MSRESVCPACERIRPDAVGYMTFTPNSVCPNCGHVETEPEEQPVKYHYHQPVPAGFLEPEFYDNGPIVTIEGRTRTIEVHRDGIAVAYLGETVLRTPGDFRATFGDGKIPERIEWINNGWFDLYEKTAEGFIHLDVVCFEIDDAIATAKSVVEEVKA